MTQVKPNPSFWTDLVSYRPSWRALGGLHFLETVQPIEKAKGKQVNLDFYSVHVTALPKVNGVEISAQAIMSQILQRTSLFVDNSYGSFEAPNWRPGLVGTVIHIEMKDPKGPLGNPDDGSVVLSSLTPTSFIFTTVDTWRDHQHPVSGNRQFGFVTLKDGSCVFYTRGADRPTGLVDDAIAGLEFDSAEELWRSFQAGIVEYIKEKGGSAKALNPVIYRPPWTAVETDLFRVSGQAPTDPAIELLSGVLLGTNLPGRVVESPVGESKSSPTRIETQSPRSKQTNQLIGPRHDPFADLTNPLNLNSPLHRRNPLNDLTNPMNPNSPLHPNNPWHNTTGPPILNKPWDIGHPTSRTTTIGHTKPFDTTTGPIRHMDAPGRTPLGPVPPIHRTEPLSGGRSRPEYYYTSRFTTPPTTIWTPGPSRGGTYHLPTLEITRHKI